jgi:antirestriction protein
MIEIYLSNLKLFNAGCDNGRWIDLPCSNLDDVFHEIVGDDEYIIADSMTDIDQLYIHEFDSVLHLNELAGRIENNELDIAAVSAFLYDGYKLEEAVEHVENNDYSVYNDCEDMADVAYYIVNESGMYNTSKEDIFTRYFDYEAFGRDLGIEGTFYFTDDRRCIEVIG